MFVFSIFSVAVIASQPSWPASVGTTKIWHALRAGHFTGVLDHDVKLRLVGTISVGKTRYALAYYGWEQTEREAIGYPHATHRLLVFEKTDKGLSYLGSYDINDPPLGVKNNRVIFDYPADGGNTVTFDEKGPPPTLSLDGQYHEFGK